MCQALQALDRRRKSGRIPVTHSPVKDPVMTPAPSAAAVIAHFSEQIVGGVLDPAKGEGAFCDQFPPHLERHWCEVTDGRGFLTWAEPVNWIVTNPPWSRLRDFTRHAGSVDGVDAPS